MSTVKSICIWAMSFPTQFSIVNDTLHRTWENYFNSPYAPGQGILGIAVPKITLASSEVNHYNFTLKTLHNIKWNLDEMFLQNNRSRNQFQKGSCISSVQQKQRILFQRLQKIIKAWALIGYSSVYQTAINVLICQAAMILSFWFASSVLFQQILQSCRELIFFSPKPPLE